MNTNHRSPLYHCLTEKILIGAIWRNFICPKTLFLAVFWYLDWVYCSQLPQNASSITYKSYLHMLHRIFFPKISFFDPKKSKKQPILAVFQCFRHMHDVYDLKCKNILNIDEYNLQYPLISLFDRKNIDWGNLAQLFWPKTLFLAVFWYLDCVYCAQLPIYASPITYTSYFHMLYRIVFLYLFIFNQKIKKTADLSHFSVFLGTCKIYII